MYDQYNNGAYVALIMFALTIVIIIKIDDAADFPDHPLYYFKLNMILMHFISLGFCIVYILSNIIFVLISRNFATRPSFFS